MREFNLDLLIGKRVVVNCKTKEEEQEFLKYLDNKGIKWNNDKGIFSNMSCYSYSENMENTCFSLTTGMLQFSPISWYQEEGYKIISLDDLIIKPKNNFKEYRFEADFEGEIYTSYKSNDNQIFYNGAIWFKPKDDYHYMKPVSWTEKGKVIHYHFQEDYLTNYSLKPIKKEWYLNKDNFEAYKGKIIINKYGNIRIIQSIDEHKVSTFEQNMYHDILKVEEWRPAAKEEVLSLLVKE